MTQKTHVLLVLILATFSVSSTVELKCWAGDIIDFEKTKFEIIPSMETLWADASGKVKEIGEFVFPNPIRYKNMTFMSLVIK